MLRSSSNPADSAYIKAYRAKTNTEALRREIRTTPFVSHYGIKFEPGAQTDEVVVSLSEARYKTGWGINQRGPRADHWPAIVGEIVHDLRSALDHLAFQLSAQINPTEYANVQRNLPPKWRRISFPLVTKKTLFEKATHSKLWALDKTPFVSFLRDQQPFARNPDAPEKEALWILNELWNADKHRSLSVLGGLVKLNRIRISGTTELVPDQFARWRPFEKGIELARLSIGDPHAEIGVDPERGIAFDIALKEHVVDSKAPLLETLEGLQREVIRVLDDFQEVYYRP